MADDTASAMRNGALAASRLHQRLGVRQALEAEGGSVDVFGAIGELGIPLLMRPLTSLLGCFMPRPAPGILVTTRRRMSIQRLTAAHELGHCELDHEPSLDDEETILRRMPMRGHPDSRGQEAEADAFAIGFMMPRWLILAHLARQAWSVDDLRRASVVYQLSLRLGSSFEATCRTLGRYKLVSDAVMRSLVNGNSPRDFKVDLLRDHRPPSYHGDVWLLTERDAGTRIEGSRDDLFVIRLRERGGAGYVWDFDQLVESGFVAVRDARENLDPTGVGGPVARRVTASVGDPRRGTLALDERRPWDPSSVAGTFRLEFDVTGPEVEGLSRADRRRRLEEA